MRGRFTIGLPVVLVALLALGAPPARGAGVADAGRMQKKGFVLFGDHWMLPAQRNHYASKFPTLTILSRRLEPVGVSIDGRNPFEVAPQAMAAVPLEAGRHVVRLTVGRRTSERYTVRVAYHYDARILCLNAKGVPSVIPRPPRGKPHPKSGVVNTRDYRIEFRDGRPVRGVLKRVRVSGHMILAFPGKTIGFDSQTWRLRKGYVYGGVEAGTCVTDRSGTFVFNDMSSDLKLYSHGLKNISIRIFPGLSDAIRRLGQMKVKSLLPRIRTLLGHEDQGVRRAAAQALGAMGDDRDLAALRAAIQAEDLGYVRQVMEAAMRQIALRSEIPQFIRRFREGDEREKMQALTQLRARVPEVEAKVFMDILAETESPVFAEMAAEALASYTGMEVAGALTGALKHANDGVRRRAARSLADVGDLRVLPQLEALLYDNDPKIRIASATALAALGVAHPIPALIERLEDENIEAREAAAGALRAITGTERGFRAGADAGTRARQVATWKAWWRE